MIGRLSLSFGVLSIVVVASACAGPSQVSFVSNERPSAQGAPLGVVPREAAHHENPNGAHQELQADDEIVEPDRPAVGTKQERALVHIHAPNDVVCSGVVLGPRIVATSQQCVKGEPKGASVLPASREYRVEVASSTLTWTSRRAKLAVVPECDFERLDVAVLVLAEPVDWVVPLKIAAAPTVGAHVHALGFGHCAGEAKGSVAKVGNPATVRNRSSDTVVIDAPLCKGDIGGPVTDGIDGEVIGLISHRDDPEGSPLKTTTIARLDTTHARDLLAQAKAIADGGETKVQPIACR
jgi:hypothetical protein